jgi:hypothetical protein
MSTAGQQQTAIATEPEREGDPFGKGEHAEQFERFGVVEQNLLLARDGGQGSPGTGRDGRDHSGNGRRHQRFFLQPPGRGVTAGRSVGRFRQCQTHPWFLLRRAACCRNSPELPARSSARSDRAFRRAAAPIRGAWRVRNHASPADTDSSRRGCPGSITSPDEPPCIRLV